MCLADAGLCKLLVTTRVGATASVWSLASVSPDVCLADAGLCKLLVTTRVGASVWSLASMNPDVCLQGGVAPSQADYPKNIFSCFAQKTLEVRVLLV